MIDLHYWPTPNGHKITLFLEEAGLDYRIVPVNIGKGAQFEPDFLRIAPNNRMPAIVDHDPADGGAPISIFESGAILIYLANKIDRFNGGPDPRGKIEVVQWLMWQMGGLGPMAGQNYHFSRYASEKIPYAIVAMSGRPTGSTASSIAGWRIARSSRAPIIRLPIWRSIRGSCRMKRTARIWPTPPLWSAGSTPSPPAIAAYAKGAEISAASHDITDAQRNILFGQTASSTAPILKS